MALIESESPWLAAAGFGRGLGNSLSSLALQLPQAQAQARVMQQQMLAEQERIPLLRAQTEETREQGLYHKARRGEIESSAKTREALGTAMWQAGQAMQSGLMDPTPFVASALEHMAQLPASERNGLAQEFTRMMAAANTDFRNQDVSTAIASGARLGPMELNQNTQAAWPVSGSPIARGPAVVASGGLYDPNPMARIENTNFRPGAMTFDERTQLESMRQEGQQLTDAKRALLQLLSQGGITPEELVDFKREAGAIVPGLTNVIPRSAVSSPLGQQTNSIVLPGGVTIRRIN